MTTDIFEPGMKVYWISQSGGHWKIKHGTVLRFVPARAFCGGFPREIDGMARRSVKFDGTVALFDRYIVVVPHITPGGKVTGRFDLYGPRASQVRLDIKMEINEQ